MTQQLKYVAAALEGDSGTTLSFEDHGSYWILHVAIYRTN